MKILAKKISVIVLLVFGFIIIGQSGLVMTASAVDCAKTPKDVLCRACNSASGSTLCQENKKTQTPGKNSIYGPEGTIGKIANLIVIAIGVASVVMIIIGGARYVMANGDANSISNAKNAILYAIIGLLVALVAKAIVIFVLNNI